MEIFNLVSGICSILGLLLTIFLATQVISIRIYLKDTSETRTTQKKNRVKNGDIAGRDINKR